MRNLGRRYIEMTASCDLYGFGYYGYRIEPQKCFGASAGSTCPPVGQQLPGLRVRRQQDSSASPRTS
jgi:hypothetical protein